MAGETLSHSKWKGCRKPRVKPKGLVIIDEGHVLDGKKCVFTINGRPIGYTSADSLCFDTETRPPKK